MCEDSQGPTGIDRYVCDVNVEICVSDFSFPICVQVVLRKKRCKESLKVSNPVYKF